MEGRPRETILVSRTTLRNVLQRVLASELNEVEVMSWANVVEAADAIQYEQSFAQIVTGIVFELSSPEINGRLTPEKCRQLLERLNS